MKGFLLPVIFLVFFGILLAQSTEPKYSEQFDKLIELHSQVKDLHSCLNDFYPIAIVNDSLIQIFDFNGDEYNLVKTVPNKNNFPNKIRAAFPMEEYDYKMVCVVTDDIFNSTEVYAVLFHEFVHCFQFNNMEGELKSELELYEVSMKNKNYMWELNHAFDYDNPEIQKCYAKFVEYAQNSNFKETIDTREILLDQLNKYDREYLVWQEWKEGFARYMENKIRTQFGLEKVNTSQYEHLNRVSFYGGGAAYIALLGRNDPELLNDLTKLYNTMKD